MSARLGWVCLSLTVTTLLSVSIVQSAQPFAVNNLLGAPCQYDYTCEIPNSYCRPQTRTCECKSGHTYSNNRDSCIRLPQRANIGDPCVNPEDCAFTAEASRCSDNVCRRCSDGSEKEFAECSEPLGGCAYHAYDGHCFRYRKLGEPCEVSEDCWIYPGSDQTRICSSSSMCQCAEGYNAMSGPLPPGQLDQCLKTSGNGSAFNIGGPCEENKDCWIFPGSDKTRTCSSSTCQCAEGYLIYDSLHPRQLDKCIRTEPGSGSALSLSFLSSMAILSVSFLVTVFTSVL